ncbi:MAG: fimbrillin family protein [Bacteroidales bacterium]|nr:fimbrillin family protein [Bacteroidales bacterium]
MKTKLFLAAIAVIAMTGCVKEEKTGVTGRTLVTFDSPVTSRNVNTKANVYGEMTDYSYGSQVTYSYPREESFKIFAVQHEGDLTSWASATATEFNGQALVYDNMVDSWAPKKDDNTYYYWPDNVKMSFAAVSPSDMEAVNASVTPAYAADGLTIADFTVPSDPAKHFDLMFSQRAANKTAANMNHTADAYSGIPLTFQHALTSIHFSLKKDVGVTEDITLMKITLKSAKNKGTFKENIDEGTDASAYVRGENGNVKPTWTVADSKEDSYVSFNGEILFPIEAQYVSSLAAADGTTDGDVSHALLLMPQTLANDVVAEIQYKVDENVKTKTVQLNTYPADTPVTEWKLGYRYTYRLYYTTDTEKKDIISFGPNTEDWYDGGVIEVRL